MLCMCIRNCVYLCIYTQILGICEHFLKQKQNSMNSNLVLVKYTYFPSDFLLMVDCRVPKTSPCEASAERFIKKQKQKSKSTLQIEQATLVANRLKNKGDQQNLQHN